MRKAIHLTLLLHFLFFFKSVSYAENISVAGDSMQHQKRVPFAAPLDIAAGTVFGISSLDAGDINGDGLADIAVIEGGKHATGKVFAWFQAPTSTETEWQRFEFTDSAPLKSFLGAAKLVDIDNDNDVDLVVSSDNHSGTVKESDIFVFINPLPNGDVHKPWNFNYITKAQPWHHINDMEAADMDDDGKMDIIVRSLEPNEIHIFFQENLSSWSKKSVSTALAQSEGLAVGRLNDDAFPDITFTGFLLRAPQQPRTQDYVRISVDAEYHTINQNTKEAVGDINGDGLFDILIAPAEAYRNGKDHDLAWYQNPGGDLTDPWKKRIIVPKTNNIHTVKLARIDDDATLDIVTGVAWGEQSVCIYYNAGDGTFVTKQILSTDKGLYSGVVVDIGHDGDMDIIGQDTYAGDSKPYLYESLLAK